MGKILIFAPHNDDETISCGGTIAKYARSEEIVVCEVTSWNANQEATQTLKNYALEAGKILGVARTVFLDLPVIGLQLTEVSVKTEAFRRVLQEEKPDRVLIPHSHDLNIDHAQTAEAALVALRPYSAPFVKEIYAYESYENTRWNDPLLSNAFMPEVYVDITEQMETKLRAFACYKNQICPYPHPRSEEGLKTLAKTNGLMCGADYAEAFRTIRIIR